jgi:hypothetical protein
MLGLKSAGWCGLDLRLTIYSILTSFFLATASWQQQKEHVLRIFTSASRAVAWPFGCKTLQIEKSTKFKSGKYGDQSAENQNSANRR